MNIVSDFPKNAGVVDDDNDSAVDDNDFGYVAQGPASGSPSKKIQVSNDSISMRNKNEKIKLVELFLKMRYPL